MFVALLAVSFITSSLAQTACDVANETLRSNADCFAALTVVFEGAGTGANSTTNATAVATVCSNSTTCNQNISAYIESCPVSNLMSSSSVINQYTCMQPFNSFRLVIVL